MAQTQDLQRLIVSLEAKLTAFDNAMARASKTADSTASKIERRFRAAESNLARFGRGVGLDIGRLAAGLGIGAVAAFVRGAVKNLAELGDAAKRAGVNVEDLQAAIFAVRQEGGNAEALIAGFSKLNLQLGEGAQKGNDLSKILKANNVAIADLAGDPVKAMLTIADLMKNARNEQDRAVIGNAAFGKSFKDLLPFLMQGSEEIARMMQTARDTGGVVDKELIAKAKEFDDAWTRTWDRFKTGAGAAAADGISAFENLWRVLRGDKLAPGQPLFTTPLEKMRFADHGPIFERVGRGGNQRASVIPRQATDEEKALQKEIARLAKESAKEKKALAVATDTLWAATKREIDEMALEANQANMSIFEFERLKKFKELIARLEDEHRQHGGAVTGDEVRNANALADAYGHMAQAVADQKNQLQQLKDVGDTVFGDLESAVDSFIDTGKLSFRDLVGSIIKDLAKLSVHNLLGFVQNGQPGTGNTGLMGLFASVFGIGAPPASTAGVLTGAPGVSRNPYDTQRGHGFIPPGADQLIKAVPLPPLAGTGGAVAVGAPGPAAQWGPFTKDIREAATAYGLDPNTLAALIQHESGFRPGIVNPTSHAAGLTQLVPGTARAMGVTDPLDPTQSIYGGARYLSQQMDHFGDVRSGLGAYYAGPGNFARQGFNFTSGGVNAGDYANSIMAQSKKYAEAVTTTAQTAAQAAGSFKGSFAPALSQVVQAVAAPTGGGSGGGGLLSTLLNVGSMFRPGVGTRAEGGPVLAGHPYVVGERGPELFMPKIPGTIIPRGGMGQQTVNVNVRAHPSKYLWIETDNRVARGDARTLDTARRSYPDTAARLGKLGTTTR